MVLPVSFSEALVNRYNITKIMALGCSLYLVLSIGKGNIGWFDILGLGFEILFMKVQSYSYFLSRLGGLTNI